ncbi:MAG: SUMF1/EgtB/PvdO family nonheme iron enzyme [Treponema sp.]|nr:SUMF1/EgtB/PvdO family nonheme iron enzyme [Treponema sp.]
MRAALLPLKNCGKFGFFSKRAFFGASSGSNRVKRGGSWNNNADNCTVQNRNNNNPNNRNNNIGFRLVRSAQLSLTCI